MSDTQPPVNDTPPPTPQSPYAAPTAVLPPNGAKPKSKLPLVAIILAGVSLLLAVIPATAFIAWIAIVPALVISIIALIKAPNKGLAIAAIIITPVAWIIAIVIAVGSFASGVSDAIDEGASAPPSASQPDEPADGQTGEDVANEAAIGDTVTNDDGVAFTVNSVTCGLATAGDNEFLTETASGQFCEVKFTLLNGSNESVSVYSSDFTGSIGQSTYDANSTVSKFGEDSFGADVNPGLSTEGTVYIDIPLDAALEYVTYSPLFSFGTGDIVVKAA